LRADEIHLAWHKVRNIAIPKDAKFAQDERGSTSQRVQS